jgi:hypothetical protein
LVAQTKKTGPSRHPASLKHPAKAARPAPQAAEYRHKEEALARPDVGTQPQFRKKAPPKTWRYESSLAPALDWDRKNPSKRALKGENEDSVRQPLAGAISVPFETDEHRQIAAKVIDDRGNELRVVKSLKGAA